MSESIRLALQTVLGFASVWLGRYSPTLQRAINVGIVLTSPDVWGRVWTIYQSEQNTPRAAVPGNRVDNHDPFEFIHHAASSSESWANHNERTRLQAEQERPTENKITPGTPPAAEELADSGNGPAVPAVPAVPEPKEGDTVAEGRTGLLGDPKASPRPGKGSGPRRRADGE